MIFFPFYCFVLFVISVTELTCLVIFLSPLSHPTFHCCPYPPIGSLSAAPLGFSPPSHSSPASPPLPSHHHSPFPTTDGQIAPSPVGERRRHPAAGLILAPPPVASASNRHLLSVERPIAADRPRRRHRRVRGALTERRRRRLILARDDHVTH